MEFVEFHSCRICTFQKASGSQAELMVILVSPGLSLGVCLAMASEDDNGTAGSGVPGTTAKLVCSSLISYQYPNQIVIIQNSHLLIILYTNWP